MSLKNISNCGSSNINEFTYSCREIIEYGIFDVLIPYIVQFDYNNNGAELIDNRYYNSKPEYFIKIELPHNLILDRDKIESYLYRINLFVSSKRMSTITGYIINEGVAEYIWSKLYLNV